MDYIRLNEFCYRFSLREKINCPSNRDIIMFCMIDNKLKPDKVQFLTYVLCHIYTQCTPSISRQSDV